MNTDNTLQICQAGKTIMEGSAASLRVIFNNLTGKNFSGKSYDRYKRFAARQGFDLSQAVELWDGQTLLESENFK